ncbi:CHASE3 domain-containing protein [Devosia sp. PTR5]|uniref:histidine kinase n=1 Tax=Devosia oryzisoli TaxID=2774138 RepID=A0A927FXM8_9HYPH|nr:CHASE3 domain-containing protein [Devosia oryzisoli]MBD8066688.1 CHASE3 domain-containing protein [Devosia oryzisoli]
MAGPLLRSRLSTRRLAVWISLALVCLAAGASLMLMQGIDRQLGDVTQTYAVRNAARELMNALSQAEANQRGYLLTRDENFLRPYREAVSSIDRRVEELLAMTQEDPGQAAKVAGITGDISTKMAEMARTIELVANARAAEAQTLTETGMGARVMTEVTQTLEAFIGEENAKLEARNAAIDRSRIGLVAALIAALAAAAILAYALLTRTQRQVTDLTVRQSGLVSQNEALEAEVAERTRAIEEARAFAEHERQRVEAILQDTNHRIGNSLATVSSLLALQMLRTPSQEVRNALEAARLRVHAIASAHRRLRLGDDLESASADEFLGTVIEDIRTTQVDADRMSITSSIEPIAVSARDATTIGILVGELVTNALKHAFPGDRTGAISVSLRREDGIAVLEVADNGVGLGPEVADGPGLGSVIIKQLSGQFGGVPDYQPRAEGGLRVRIALPELGAHRPPADPSPMEP